MTTEKIHKIASALSDGWKVTLCGRQFRIKASSVSDSADTVNCKNCLKKMDHRKREPKSFWTERS